MPQPGMGMMQGAPGMMQMGQPGMMGGGMMGQPMMQPGKLHDKPSGVAEANLFSTQWVMLTKIATGL